MKNNLPPDSQQWVRSIENKISALERQVPLSEETNRQQNVVLSGLSKSVAEIISQQELVYVNSVSSIISLPFRSSQGTSFSVEIPSLLPNLEEFSGVVTFKLSPIVSVGGASGGSFSGQVSSRINFSGGLSPIMVAHHIEADSTQVNLEDRSVTLPVSTALLVSSIDCEVQIYGISGTVAVSLGGNLITSYTIQKGK